MGRHYTGDINGKFWFAVQSSNDADFFGVEGVEPETLEYRFEECDKPKVKQGIAKCKKVLGSKYSKLQEFFNNERDCYNDEEVRAYLKLETQEETRKALMWYARLELGNKILECLDYKGYCSFTAEL